MLYNLSVQAKDAAYIKSIIPPAGLISEIQYGSRPRILFVVNIAEEEAVMLTLRYGIENIWKR